MELQGAEVLISHTFRHKRYISISSYLKFYNVWAGPFIMYGLVLFAEMIPNTN